MNRPVFLSADTPPHLFTLVIIASLSVLSMNMLLPALPAVTDHFKTSYAIAQLTISGYLGVTGLLQIFFGPLSDRYGRRPIMLLGLMIFSVASLICLFAPNIETFLIGRILQAASATGIALSRAIIRDLYDTNEAASMLGYTTVGMMVIPMFSPLLGGLFVEYINWQANFVFMFILGLILLFIVYQDLGETNKNQSSSMMAQIKSYPELLGSRRFWGYTLTASFTSGAYFSLLGGGPFVAREHLGLDGVDFGIYFLTISTGYMLGNFISGRYSKTVGINKMMLRGGFISVMGISISLTFILFGYIHAVTFFGPIFFVGLGNGMTLPNANAGMVSIRPELAGSASGLGGAAMIGGGAGLAAFAASILTVESGPTPLIICMLTSSVMALLNTFYVIYVEKHSNRKI